MADQYLKMSDELRSPKFLAEQVLESVNQTLSASLESCEGFAEAWTNYTEGAWDNSEIMSFFETLYQSGIGPNPLSLKPDRKGKYRLAGSAASFFIIKAIGAQLAFKNPKKGDVQQLR
jgi:hypothetical protein